MTGARAFLGVDGGATRCRVRLRDAAGRFLAEAEGPPANIYFDFETAMAVVAATIGAAAGQIGLQPDDMAGVAAGLGLAGVASPADEQRVAARFAFFASVRAANDAVTACLGAHAGADGGVVIAGTGSAALAQVAGRRSVIGGRGFILGDDGSAARVGYDALRCALRAHDRLGPVSALTQCLMARFGDDPVALQQWAPTAKPSDFGSFAPMVFEAARAADPVGLAIVEAAGAAVGALGCALRRLDAERLALVGGLAEVIRPFLPPAALALFSPPLLDATDGAILLAGGEVANDTGAAAAAMPPVGVAQAETA